MIVLQRHTDLGQCAREIALRAFHGHSRAVATDGDYKVTSLDTALKIGDGFGREKRPFAIAVAFRQLARKVLGFREERMVNDDHVLNLRHFVRLMGAR